MLRSVESPTDSTDEAAEGGAKSKKRKPPTYAVFRWLDAGRQAKASE